MLAPVVSDPVNATFEMQALSIQTDVFDCIFRFLSAILQEQLNYPESEFWEQVYKKIVSYQEQFPEHQKLYRQLNLLSDKFKLCCLNRHQLKNTKQMLDLSDPINTLEIHGQLNNPITKTLISV